jgi:hypothetical protein
MRAFMQLRCGGAALWVLRWWVCRSLGVGSVLSQFIWSVGPIAGFVVQVSVVAREQFAGGCSHRHSLLSFTFFSRRGGSCTWRMSACLMCAHDVCA